MRCAVLDVTRFCSDLASGATSSSSGWCGTTSSVLQQQLSRSQPRPRPQPCHRPRLLVRCRDKHTLHRCQCQVRQRCRAEVEAGGNRRQLIRELTPPRAAATPVAACQLTRPVSWCDAQATGRQGGSPESQKVPCRPCRSRCADQPPAELQPLLSPPYRLPCPASSARWGGV